MANLPDPHAPTGTMTADQFYSQNEQRATGRSLGYGSGWKQEGWSDETHVVEVYWMKDSHELVVFYVAYDWSRVDPTESTVSAAEAVGAETGGGVELGNVLRMQDEATTDVYVEVLAHLGTHDECRKAMHGWHWLQHHPDGLEQLRQRVARRSADDPGD